MNVSDRRFGLLLAVALIRCTANSEDPDSNAQQGRAGTLGQFDAGDGTTSVAVGPGQAGQTGNGGAPSTGDSVNHPASGSSGPASDDSEGSSPTTAQSGASPEASPGPNADTPSPDVDGGSLPNSGVNDGNDGPSTDSSDVGAGGNGASNGPSDDEAPSGSGSTGSGETSPAPTSTDPTEPSSTASAGDVPHVPLEELTHAGCTQDPDYESFAVDGYCTQYLRCDDVGYVASSCSSNDDDDKTVSCDCDSANGPHYHLLVDQLDGIATCDRVTEMCRQETPVQFHGGYDCKLTVHDSGPLDCEIAKHCRREEQQPNDLIALEIGNPDTRCLTGAAIPDAPIGADPLAPGDFAKCDCDANSSIELADTPMDEVCEIAQNVCFFGMLPTSTGEASCEPDADALDSAADHCHAAQRCKQPSAIGDASAAISAEYSVDCAPAQNGSEWSCSCDDGARTSSYSVSPSAASADTCAAALAQCQTSLTVVPTSELSCKVVENSIDRSVSEMCTQTVVCTASGVSGDLTVTRQGRASMRCWPEGGAPSCYCDAQGHETYEYNFESDLSVEELCGHEISACADRIDFNAPLVQPAQPR